jgi:hypothetical protein
VLTGVGVIVVVGAALGVFFAVRGGGSGGTSAASGSPSPSATTAPVPSFSFNLASVHVLPTGTKKGVLRAAHAAATHIRTALDTVYATGFVDPRTWSTGHYGKAWGEFTKEAIGRARSDENTLTLGARADRVFTSVMPHTGRLDVRILIDPRGHPSTAVANVTFAARGTMRSGQHDVIRSNGHYFLRPRAHGWAIYAYEVTRDDAAEPAPTPSSSASSPSAGATP